MKIFWIVTLSLFASTTLFTLPGRAGISCIRNGVDICDPTELPYRPPSPGGTYTCQPTVSRPSGYDPRTSIGGGKGLSEAASATVGAPAIAIDTPWKEKLIAFSKQYSLHTSWGHSHGLRNYKTSLEIAKDSGVTLDTDVFLAASLLHDIGGLAPFEVKGKDHAVRSAEVAKEVLLKIDFPSQKIAQVQRIILDHTYYGPKPTSIPSKIFRDADILDFLGIVGFARVIAASEEMNEKEKTLKTGLKVFETLVTELPAKISTPSAKMRAKLKLLESQILIGRIKGETMQGEDL